MANLNFLSEFRKRESTVGIRQANWYMIAVSEICMQTFGFNLLIVIQAVSLAASGAGHNVPDLYRIATAGLSLEDEKIVQRRIKEAILKTSILYGFPKALQALLPLFSILNEDAIDDYGPRLVFCT
jgi:hypothetical protein